MSLIRIDTPEELGETSVVIQLGNEGDLPGQCRHTWGFRETSEVRVETYGKIELPGKDRHAL